jgi:hypothetical protein
MVSAEMALAWGVGDGALPVCGIVAAGERPQAARKTKGKVTRRGTYFFIADTLGWNIEKDGKIQLILQAFFAASAGQTDCRLAAGLSET